MVAVKAPSSLCLLLSVPLYLLGGCASHPTAPRPVAARATLQAPAPPTQEQTAGAPPPTFERLPPERLEIDTANRFV